VLGIVPFSEFIEVDAAAIASGTCPD
jgi:hypothetical protein